MGDDDPKSGIPENAISFEEAFEQVFDVACPDAKELRRALDAAGPTVPETYNEETWLAACEAWDIARHEVWEIFKSELVYCLDGTLIAYLEGERLKRGYWEAQEFSDNVHESIYFRPHQFGEWLKRFTGQKSNAGRKPKIDPVKMKKFIFATMDDEGPFDPQVKEWNGIERLAEKIRERFGVAEAISKRWANKYYSDWKASKQGS